MAHRVSGVRGVSIAAAEAADGADFSGRGNEVAALHPEGKGIDLAAQFASVGGLASGADTGVSRSSASA
jgi:hypothetical protein